jgi:hypothetical protein
MGWPKQPTDGGKLPNYKESSGDRSVFSTELGNYDVDQVSETKRIFYFSGIGLTEMDFKNTSCFPTAARAGAWQPLGGLQLPPFVSAHSTH